MPKYKDKIIEDIYKNYREFFSNVKSREYSLKQLDGINSDIVNGIKEYKEILADINQTNTNLSYKVETVKEYLNFELELNAIALRNTTEGTGTHDSLLKSQGHLKNALDTYDRDMINSNNYQAVYTRNKRDNSLYSKEKLPKDDVVFILQSQVQKITKEAAGLASEANPFYEISNNRSLVVDEIKIMYKAVQKELLKDVLPIEQIKTKKAKSKGYER
ncbi:MAG: hypothetical protein LBH40_04080 [Alphaproteobacteria bacterium]|jgi:hypothetical protein|nr:hypothetical protein [Alphaproteobacteria bacterium]